MTDKERDFKKISNPEERLQFLYREIFHMSDKIEDMHRYLEEMGQLFVNYIKEQEKKKKK